MSELDTFLDCLIARLTRWGTDDRRMADLRRIIQAAREDAKLSTDPIRVPVSRRALNASAGPGKPPRLIPYAGKE